jgi:26S proteasome regulatory subunit N1
LKEPEKKDKKKDDKKEEETKEETPVDLSGQQAIAVLGLGLLSMGEDIGSEMMYRTLGHLMRYELNIFNIF